MSGITYPEIRKDDTVDTYFGTDVADPYRWLEDDLSSETKEFVEAQNKITFEFLDKIPFRSQLKQQLTDAWNYERYSLPFIRGDYTYYHYNDGLSNQPVLKRRKNPSALKDGEEAIEEVFIDPNTLSEDGTTSLASIEFTEDGSLAAYCLSIGGSDWRTVHVINTTTKEHVGVVVKDVKFSSIAWNKNEGFFYSSYDKPVGSELSSKTDQHKLYYHKIGTEQSQDINIFGHNDAMKRRYVFGVVSDDSKYLFIAAANSTSGNELYVKALYDANSMNDTDIIPLSNGFKYDYDYVDVVDDVLYVETNDNAPNKRLISIELTQYTKDVSNAPKPIEDEGIINANVVIAETKDVLSVSTAGGYLFAQYMKDALSYVQQLNYDGTLVRVIDLPGYGTVHGFSAKRKETVAYYAFTNYTTPGAIYSYDISTGVSTLYISPKISLDLTNLESKQIFYTSKDGVTKIPMMITYNKQLLKEDGSNPTILYGYGGFNISLTPAFSVPNAVWVANGGILAIPNIRGGGEYGKEWHLQGTKQNKQNVFDDFIAAGHYLIEQKYTTSDYLAIRGGSNGGLLVGACMTQQPQLFKVALPAVGVLDMLRYHTFTAGAGWAYDYGTSDDDKDMFEYLHRYSPLHNVKEGTIYPATLVTTADHDDRVVPAHSFKFAAELQAKAANCKPDASDKAKSNPLLTRIDVKSGHGAGKSVSMMIAEQTDVFAFTLYNMGFTQLPSATTTTDA